MSVSSRNRLAAILVVFLPAFHVQAESEFGPYADVLSANGIISRKSSHEEYRVDDALTRSEAVKIAVLLSGNRQAVCTGKTYSDVTQEFGDLCGYVEAAARIGIVSQDADAFRPTEAVTRAEMTKMFLSAKKISPSSRFAGYSDVPESLWDLAEYVNAGAERGILTLGEYFRPNETSTRGEAFKIAAKVLGIGPGSGISAGVPRRAVSIRDFGFAPSTITVRKGTAIVWTNEDATAHSVKFAAFESGLLEQGDRYAYEFKEKWSFAYECGTNPSMRGTVNVTD